jgi:hypothetical protein
MFFERERVGENPIWSGRAPCFLRADRSVMNLRAGNKRFAG